METLQSQLVTSVGYRSCVRLFLFGLLSTCVLASLLVFPSVRQCAQLSLHGIYECSADQYEHSSTLRWKLSISLVLLLQCSIPLLVGHFFIQRLRTVAPLSEPTLGTMIIVSWSMWAFLLTLVLITLSVEYLLNSVHVIRDTPTLYRMCVFTLNSVGMFLLHRGIAHFWALEKLTPREDKTPISVFTASVPNNAKNKYVDLEMTTTRRKACETLCQSDECRRQALILLYHNLDCRFSLFHIPTALLLRIFVFSHELGFTEAVSRVSVESCLFIWSFILIGRFIQLGVEASLPLLLGLGWTLPDCLMDRLRKMQVDRAQATWFVMFMLFAFAMSFGWKNPYIAFLASLMVSGEKYVVHWIRFELLGVLPSQDGAFIPWYFHRDMIIVSGFIVFTAAATLPFYEPWVLALVCTALVYIYLLRRLLKLFRRRSHLLPVKPKTIAL